LIFKPSVWNLIEKVLPLIGSSINRRGLSFGRRVYYEDCPKGEFSRTFICCDDFNKVFSMILLKSVYCYLTVKRVNLEYILIDNFISISSQAIDVFPVRLGLKALNETQKVLSF
jgi:hypothetical protein